MEVGTGNRNRLKVKRKPKKCDLEGAGFFVKIHNVSANENSTGEKQKVGRTSKIGFARTERGTEREKQREEEPAFLSVLLNP